MGCEGFFCVWRVEIGESKAYAAFYCMSDAISHALWKRHGLAYDNEHNHLFASHPYPPNLMPSGSLRHPLQTV